MTIKGFIIALVVGFLVYQIISIPLGVHKKKKELKEKEIKEKEGNE